MRIPDYAQCWALGRCVISHHVLKELLMKYVRNKDQWSVCEKTQVSRYLVVNTMYFMYLMLLTSLLSLFMQIFNILGLSDDSNKWRTSGNVLVFKGGFAYLYKPLSACEAQTTISWTSHPSAVPPCSFVVLAFSPPFAACFLFPAVVACRLPSLWTAYVSYGRKQLGIRALERLLSRLSPLVFRKQKYILRTFTVFWARQPECTGSGNRGQGTRWDFSTMTHQISPLLLELSGSSCHNQLKQFVERARQI